jgi:CBS domain-containing protein
MLARDIMRKEVFTVREDEPVDALIEMLVREHIHGAPVINRRYELVGVVTQQDIFFSAVTLRRDAAAAGDPAGEGGQMASRATDPPRPLTVSDIMTAPALHATEETDVVSLCRMMHRLRIHRVPIVSGGRVTGIVSSLDICAAVARGDLGS